jgi:hypothetical protein
MVDPAMEGMSRASVPQTGTVMDQVNAIRAQMGADPITKDSVPQKPYDNEADVPEKEMVEVPVGQVATTSDPGCSVTLYQHGNYGGSSYTTNGSIPRMGPIKFAGTQTSMNDQVSSMKIN